MTEHHDPRIQRLFVKTEEPLEDLDFSVALLAQVATLQRGARVRRAALIVISVVVLMLVASPLQTVVVGLCGLLAHPIVRLDQPLLAQALLPVNNAAFVVAVMLLAWRAMRARLFGSVTQLF